MKSIFKSSNVKSVRVYFENGDIMGVCRGKKSFVIVNNVSISSGCLECSIESFDHADICRLALKLETPLFCPVQNACV